MTAAPSLAGIERLIHMPQELPLDHPDSSWRFRSPLVATPAAIEEFGFETIAAHYRLLGEKAERHAGLDYLQVFRDAIHPDRRLWFIEDDGEEAHVTALLPNDY